MSDTASDVVIALLGPTATAKSAVAIEIAKKLPIEIISVDSALIYKGMDIGTAKPELRIRNRIPHYLIDIVEPDEYYSAARFREDALDAIAHIRQRQRIPLLVGGTMFYFNVLEHGLSPMPETDPATRTKLIERYRTVAKLYEKLKAVDPKTAARIHPNDKQRMLRALGVYWESGQTMSRYQTLPRQTMSAPTIRYIAFDFDDRARLHRHIERRLGDMLRRGLLNEVAKLMLRGDLNVDSAAMRTIAYRQVWQHLIGRYGYSYMVQSILAASRQFAKRQLTWMKKIPIIARYAVDEMTVKQLADQIIENHISVVQS